MGTAAKRDGAVQNWPGIRPGSRWEGLSHGCEQWPWVPAFTETYMARGIPRSSVRSEAGTCVLALTLVQEWLLLFAQLWWSGTYTTGAA